MRCTVPAPPRPAPPSCVYSILTVLDIEIGYDEQLQVLLIGLFFLRLFSGRSTWVFRSVLCVVP